MPKNLKPAVNLHGNPYATSSSSSLSQQPTTTIFILTCTFPLCLSIILFFLCTLFFSLINHLFLTHSLFLSLFFIFHATVCWNHQIIIIESLIHIHFALYTCDTLDKFSSLSLSITTTTLCLALSPKNELNRNKTNESQYFVIVFLLIQLQISFSVWKNHRKR